MAAADDRACARQLVRTLPNGAAFPAHLKDVRKLTSPWTICATPRGRFGATKSVSQIDSNVQLGVPSRRKRRVASFRERFGITFRSDIDDRKHATTKSARRERRDGRACRRGISRLGGALCSPQRAPLLRKVLRVLGNWLTVCKEATLAAMRDTKTARGSFFDLLGELRYAKDSELQKVATEFANQKVPQGTIIDKGEPESIRRLNSANANNSINMNGGGMTPGGGFMRGGMGTPAWRQTASPGFEREHHHPCELQEVPVVLVVVRRQGVRQPWVVEEVDSILLARRLQEAAWDSIEPA